MHILQGFGTPTDLRIRKTTNGYLLELAASEEVLKSDPFGNAITTTKRSVRGMVFAAAQLTELLEVVDNYLAAGDGCECTDCGH